MKYVTDTLCGENGNTILCATIFFFENNVVYEMWKNIVEPDRTQETILRAHAHCMLHT